MSHSAERLIMLTCGSRKMEFRHDGKLIGQNAYGRFGSIQLLENRNQAIRRFSAYP